MSNPQAKGFQFVCYRPNESVYKSGEVAFTNHDQKQWFLRFIQWAVNHDHTIDVTPIEKESTPCQ